MSKNRIKIESLHSTIQPLLYLDDGFSLSFRTPGLIIRPYLCTDRRGWLLAGFPPRYKSSAVALLTSVLTDVALELPRVPLLVAASLLLGDDFRGASMPSFRANSVLDFAAA